MALRPAFALLLVLLLAQACSREETRTVVVSGQGTPAASAPQSAAAPPAQEAASAPVAQPAEQAEQAEQAASAAADAASATAQASPPPAPLASQPAEPRGPDGPALLALRPLIVPVQGVQPSQLVDTYLQGREGHRHEAIDIPAAKGTPVFAVDDGTLVKLFKSKPGGLTAYQFDPEGNLAYYYAHLDGYAAGLKEGMMLRRGDLIGYVGVTGNSAPDAPHLHFAVFRLGPERQWWKGDPVNPYPALRRAQPAR